MQKILLNNNNNIYIYCNTIGTVEIERLIYEKFRQTQVLEQYLGSCDRAS